MEIDGAAAAGGLPGRARLSAEAHVRQVLLRKTGRAPAPAAVRAKMRHLRRLLAALGEKNVSLFARLVTFVDAAACDRLAREAVAAAPAMATADGSPPTPGGAFIRLLKPQLSPAEIAFLWGPQNREHARFKRDARKNGTQKDRAIRGALRKRGGAAASPPPEEAAGAFAGPWPENPRPKPAAAAAASSS